MTQWLHESMLNVMSHRYHSNTVQPVCPGYKMTIFDGGRLGNKMGEYATLLAHSKRLGFEPVITPAMKKYFKYIFKSTSFRGKKFNGYPYTRYTVEALSNITSCKQLPRTVKIDWVIFQKTLNYNTYSYLHVLVLSCSHPSAGIQWTWEVFTLTWKTYGEN